MRITNQLLCLLSALALACGSGDDKPKTGTNDDPGANNQTSNSSTNNVSSRNTNSTVNSVSNNTTTNTSGTNNSTGSNNANTTNNTTGTNGQPGTVAGPDVSEPFPIDRGDDPDTPGSYKSLPLRLVDTGAPTVTPVDGMIGVVCIGMSNSNQECGDYMQKLARGLSDDVATNVVWVNCAVGGNAIERWNDPANDADLWDACINQRIGAEGLTVDQVRVVYHKAANQFTRDLPEYPDPNSDYFNFYDNLGDFAARLATKLPNVVAVYTTSRSFGGFSTNPGRGEPLSYTEGHALNSWLADNPMVDGVWYGWGPYIWAPDCASGETNASGVCYVRDDYQDDGVHPAAGARDKISEMIHDHFLNQSWYAR